MALLLETIKIENGKIFYLPYHQERVNQSRKLLLNAKDRLDLSLALSFAPSEGLFKCRILYDIIIHKIEYLPYTPKTINSINIINSNIEYQFKYTNRELFDILLKRNNQSDDIIIKRNGYLTDTTFANIAFYDRKKWVTPESPLLKGTTRQRLIKEGFLHPQNITKEMLEGYSKMAITNAMVGFKILDNIKPDTIKEIE